MSLPTETLPVASNEKVDSRERVSAPNIISTFDFADQRLRKPIIKDSAGNLVSLIDYLRSSPQPKLQAVANDYESILSVGNEVFQRQLPSIDNLGDDPFAGLDEILQTQESRALANDQGDNDNSSLPKAPEQPARVPKLDRVKGQIQDKPAGYPQQIRILTGTAAALKTNIVKLQSGMYYDQAQNLKLIKELVELLISQFATLYTLYDKKIKNPQALLTPELLLLERAKISLLRDPSQVLPEDRRKEFLEEDESNKVSRNAQSIISYLRGLFDEKGHKGMPGMYKLLSKFTEMFGPDNEFLPVGKYGENLLKVIQELDLIERRNKDGKQIRVNTVLALLGPTGSGKTALAKEAAKVIGLPHFELALSNLNYDSPTEVRERIQIKGGNSELVPTEVGNMIIGGGVLIFDEFTKLDSTKQGVYNQILGLKPGDRLNIAGKEVVVHKNFRVVITGNRPSDGSYAAYNFTPDTQSRINTMLEVDYVHPYGYNFGELGEKNTKTSLTVETDDQGRATKLSEAGSSERISDFWKHEFTSVALLRFTDSAGELNMSKKTFGKLLQFIERINLVHDQTSISLREIDSMINKWKNDPKRDPTDFLKDFVKTKILNKQQSDSLIDKIQEANVFTDFDDQPGDIKIPFSVLAGVLGVQDTLAPEKDPAKEQEIKELKLQMDKLLAEVQAQFENGYCRTYFQQQKLTVAA